MADPELYRLTARAAVNLLRRGEVTPAELIAAAATRIAATDGALNALPTLCLDRARDHAKRMAAGRASRGEGAGALYGLPIAVKDLNPVAGVRTTQGSPIFADDVPARSDIMVETLEANGAIVVAKSNTPEFGAGAQTYNPVFGTTANPWDTSKTCAGSSGGAAVALAAGQVWLATGSDLGGSLRTPASFCGVVGFRPSPGRVATGPESLPFGLLSVEGPMARNVADCALMLDAMVGELPEDPRSLPAPLTPFQAAVDAPVAPARVAYSPNLGILPVEREVAEICEAAVRKFADIGATVELACPDFADAPDTFQTLRAAGFATSMAEFYINHKDKLKPEIIWNIEKGQRLTIEEVGRAERARGALFHRVFAFFRTWDLLVTPTAIVAPFDKTQHWVTEVEGQRLDDYVAWLTFPGAITLAACPAISVPCGFTRAGLPVGLQFVAAPRAEARLLSAAKLFEDAAGLASGLPIDPRPPR
ncbi:MAG: amidase [Alphaproteobacteria bacterium]|nr:amidase [Alphaproteobacteria bacterium]